jgi:hypothetical protein
MCTVFSRVFSATYLGEKERELMSVHCMGVVMGRQINRVKGNREKGKKEEVVGGMEGRKRQWERGYTWGRKRERGRRSGRGGKEERGSGREGRKRQWERG